MIEKVEGLVVRCIKYGESSLIFDLYTRQHGLVSCIIGGVRKSKSRTPAPLFQLMNWLELVLYFKEPSALNRVKECTLLYNYRQIPFDMRRRSIGLFMTEMVQKTVREREANTELYAFLRSIYTHLDETELSVNNLHLLFLVRLSGYLGFFPHGNWEEQCPFFNMLTGTFEPVQHPLYALDQGQSRLLSGLLDLPLNAADDLKLKRLERRAIIQDLLTFYRLHIEKLPEIQTHKILAEVLDG